MTITIVRVHPVHMMNADWPPEWMPTLRPSQPTWAVSPLINGCHYPHSPSPFVIITQPESWYSFHCPTEGGRLSQPRHCRKHVQPGSKAVYCSGCHDKQLPVAWPLTLQTWMLPLDHCGLQRQLDVA